MKKAVIVLIALVILFAGIQLIPYGHNHTNPPVTAEPQWDSPQTQELFARACGDCHSNQTTWPPYSSIAPLSWLIQNHVEEGRQKLNVSEWDRGGQNEANEAAETVQEGEMPPKDYLLLHPEARLSAAEKEALIRGLQATFGSSD
ncbi:MAG: heme-binding domain-containing protein [Chloroflexi bacterium]|nr:heme-binding domain-containing protein [Chloroflexota bacterium]